MKSIKELKKQLKDIKDKTESTSQHECVLKALDDEINYVSEVGAEEKAWIKNACEEEINEVYKNHLIESQNLQKSIESMMSLYAEVNFKFLQEEKRLRDKDRKLRTNLQNLINDYDKQMFGREDKCKKIKKMKPIKEEYDNIMQERDLKEKQERIAKERRKRHQAARMVQSVWRGYKCRKFIKVLRAKRSGKKAKVKQQ
ncbi:uncharacterized protein PFB0145c-like [Centruroides sculpturatus]|uniref:uncharacterized protein PFB0145c-like n=1 Tax=Centruroides sculpturatus TaxID=218467 RepID=UPI000C6DCD0A|nr:uncharacterized protein PFB0145c-like [Centruroides sculpturatus]